ncbi:MAG: hypothetical protein WC998_01495 [Candidatus Paceibacterota bacterium]|jgi:hypothetical protein
MAPPKGKSNNLAGRPPKSKALSELLRKDLNRTYLNNAGQKIAAKRIITKRVIDALVTGKWQLADGTFTYLSFGETAELIKWVFLRVDGQPQAAINVTSDGESLTNVISVVVHNGDSSDPT